MASRNKIKVDQLDGYPADITKVPLGLVDSDGNNQWGDNGGSGVFPQDYPNISGEFLDSYDSSTGLFTSSTPSGGGGGSFPFTVLQEAGFQSGGNVNSFVVTFPITLQASGATAFMLVACDGSAAVGVPSGWTTDLNVQQNTYARFLLVHKTSAGDTSATFTASNSSFAVYFFELSGSHSLDQSSTGGVANTDQVILPAITPTAGSLVFGMSCQVASTGFPYNPILNPMGTDWRSIGFAALTGGGRALFGHISTVAATNTSTTPPIISNPGSGLFASGGIAYATFSIL